MTECPFKSPAKLTDCSKLWISKDNATQPGSTHSPLQYKSSGNVSLSGMAVGLTGPYVNGMISLIVSMGLAWGV